MPSNVCTPAALQLNRYMILLLAFLIFCLPVYGLKLFLFKYVNKRSELIHNDFRIVDIYRYLLKIHQPLNFSSPQPAALVTAPSPSTTRLPPGHRQAPLTSLPDPPLLKTVLSSTNHPTA